jgi:hypothetical protein
MDAHHDPLAEHGTRVSRWFALRAHDQAVAQRIRPRRWPALPTAPGWPGGCGEARSPYGPQHSRGAPRHYQPRAAMPGSTIISLSAGRCGYVARPVTWSWPGQAGRRSRAGSRPGLVADGAWDVVGSPRELAGRCSTCAATENVGRGPVTAEPILEWDPDYRPVRVKLRHALDLRIHPGQRPRRSQVASGAGAPSTPTRQSGRAYVVGPFQEDERPPAAARWWRRVDVGRPVDLVVSRVEGLGPPSLKPHPVGPNPADVRRTDAGKIALM